MRARTRLICMSGACSELVGSGVHMWPICAHHDQRCRHSVASPSWVAGAPGKEQLALVEPRIPKSVKHENRPVHRPVRQPVIEPAVSGRPRAGQRAPVRSWPRNGGGWPQLIRRPMRSATRGADPRVEVGGDVEREVAWSGASGRVAVVQAADLCRMPTSRYTWSAQPGHLDRIPAGSRRAVAVAHRTPRVAAQGPSRTRPGPQEQSAWLDVFWQRAAADYRCLLGASGAVCCFRIRARTGSVLLAGPAPPA